MIKSPYNFVPAPAKDEVFHPEWAEQVSHDIPFSYGESGEITFTITARTPIFIRNGHSKKDHEVFERWRDAGCNDDGLSEEDRERLNRYLSFSNYNGKYFIPATSIKGMLRNVLEIMTNSKLTQLNNQRHAVRQIMRTQGTVVDEGYELTNMAERKKIKCGYLIQKNDKYYIYSCEKPYKIRYIDIDEKYNVSFEAQFGEQNEAKINENFDNRTAKYKYELLERKQLEADFLLHPLDEDEKQKSWVSIFQPLQYVKFANGDNDVDSFLGKGMLVCTGQASNYTVSTARKGEYVFLGEKSKILKNESLRIEISKRQFEDFKFINRDGMGDSSELVDWSFWKNKIGEGIPVFYREGTLNGKKIVIDFGLTYMYKQPAKYSVKDLVPQYDKSLDLATLIFGSAEKNEAFKGRVFISNSWEDDITERENIASVKVMLGSPKSSFFPNYLKQSGNNQGVVTSYMTYNTAASELRGFKRYTHRNEVFVDNGDVSSLHSFFKPLPENTKFNAKIRFHNLREIELGALIASLTLLNQNDVCHNLGLAKPYGFGSVEISDLNLINVRKTLNEYLQTFECEMLARDINWKSRIIELLNIAKFREQNDIGFPYNDLTEFQIIKNNGYYLRNFSELKPNFEYNQSVSQSSIEQRKNQINAEQIAKEAELIELRNQYSGYEARNDFDEMKRILILINRLSPIDEIDQLIKDIDQKIADQNSKLEFEAMLTRRNLEELQNFRNANPHHEHIDEVNRIIKELSPAQYPDRFRTIPIDNLLREASLERNRFVVDPFSRNLTHDIERGIRYALNNRREAERWQNFENIHTWGKVINLIGQTAALELYNRLFP